MSAPNVPSLHGKHLVAGAPERAAEASFHATDPSTGEALEPRYAEATQQEIDRAVRAAQDAFTAYRRWSGADRASFLEGIAAALEDARPAIVDRAMRETGLPDGRLNGELGRTTGQLQMFAELVREGSWVDARIDPGDPERTPAPRPDIRRMLIPMGPMAVFGASNFPLAFSVAGGDTASALASGCPVVVKAHPAHPGTSELVGAAIAAAARAAGAPEGVFSLVHGAGIEVGQALVLHAGIRGVAFTGSLRGGRALFDAAAGRDEPIPVFAEMGSVNPVFVLPDALRMRPDNVATGLHGSFTLGAGQFCTNPGVVVVRSGDGLDAFTHKLAALTRATPPTCMLHAGIRDAFERGAERLGSVDGVREVGRSGTESDGPTDALAVVFRVDAETFLADERLHDEVFGPSTLLVVADSAERVKQVARALRGHLTATLIGDQGELTQHADLMDTLAQQVGRVIVNGYPTGVEVTSAMQHGGPYPATTDPRFTSIGTAAILRFVRPVAYQDVPDALLPEPLRNTNPLGLLRLVRGSPTHDPIASDG